MPDIFLGVLSGTSMDAVDVAAVDFSLKSIHVIETLSIPYPPDLRQALYEFHTPGTDEINRICQLDRQVGMLFANACNHILQKIGISKDKVSAIGSHGQTIRHQPTCTYPYTFQIGDPNVIAALTGITTVADFRRRDIACGGQGAPLTPSFHHFAFHTIKSNRIILNIGGISNLTFLPANQMAKIVGYDSGPGNTLLDQWIKHNLGLSFDNEGSFAKQGRAHNTLLAKLLEDAYFYLQPPKSTGPDYFNLSWLQKRIQGFDLTPQDIQSTLSELTAQSILRAIKSSAWHSAEILVCGGGIHNKDLLARITSQLPEGFSLSSTAELGVDPNWVEAIAFAWLAKQTLHRLPGNLPDVTGASEKAILGGIYQA
jgi:anhydro-N-acetylmuramic acid kinase